MAGTGALAIADCNLYKGNGITWQQNVTIELDEKCFSLDTTKKELYLWSMDAVLKPIKALDLVR